MLYCAYRLGLPWRQYLEKHDHLDHLVWWEWFMLHDWQDMRFRKKDPYECIIGEHVSQETWDRWEAKVAGAKWQLLAGGGKGGVSFNE